MKFRIIFILWLLSEIAFTISLKAQFIDGHIYSSQDAEPVSSALISVSGTSLRVFTDAEGYFQITWSQLNTCIENGELPKIDVSGHLLTYSGSGTGQLKIYDLTGKCLNAAAGNSGSIDFTGLQAGIYPVEWKNGKNKVTARLIYTKNGFLNNRFAFYNNYVFTITVEKTGFQTAEFSVKPGKNKKFKLSRKSTLNADYLNLIPDETTYGQLEGAPLNPAYGEVTTVNFIYQITNSAIYYINSNRYSRHFEFAVNVLGYPKDLYFFNAEQYKQNPQRIYLLGAINYFRSSGTYVIEFFATDDINCEQVNTVYNKLLATTYFGNHLYLFPNSAQRNNCTGVPIITTDELYGGQNYQCLNPEENYGYLRKIDISSIDKEYLGKHDIVLTNGIPIDIPVVSGIITTEFQTVLSHINVLSHNRGTPNMALRDGWTNPDLLAYENQLVYFHVMFDHYEIRPATLSEAQHYWDTHEPQQPVILAPDLETKGLIEPEDLNLSKISVVGGKAANFGELVKVNSPIGKLNLPEGPFAIPFYYYNQHIKKYGLDKFIAKMLADDQFKSNIEYRKEYLHKLRDSIKDSPIDPEFYTLLNARLSQYNFTNFRFRSSTNAEDVENFNGAGLYDSKTGIFNSTEQPVDEAVKKVWASLWNFSAFEEREYFKIDHQTVAMGILVHRSFPDELANGVVITENIYNENLPALTINSQFNEISVVSPEEGYLPEQVLYYIYDNTSTNNIDYINYSNVPGMSSKTVLTTQELNELATYCKAIMNHYYSLGSRSSLDIEFKIDLDHTGRRTVFIKQCRPYIK